MSKAQSNQNPGAWWGLTKIAFATMWATLYLPGVAYAGNGTFDGGVHNFCVSVRFNATNAQRQQIRTAFQNGSQILADATDGQHRFGTVRIVNNSGASNSADYWINPGDGRAYATYGKYGVRGQHVNLYFNSNFQAANGADGDAYTIAHEHAHHSYGVADEYSGPSGAAESAPASAESPTLNYSLMDNYFTRGGRAFGGGYTLNEFDVASNFDPDMNTWQYSMHRQSVWETIAAHSKRSATAPTGLPVDAPPGPHAVTFVDGIGDLRVALLIDRSGSMSIEDRLTFAKLGANQFINLLSNNDGVGVTSFSSSTSVDFPLTTITNASTKSAATGAVNSLSASGATNIGGGLLTALGQLTPESNRSCNEIVVLLSDGDHNTGTSPDSVIPTLQREGVTVLTVGVGGGISTAGQATLQNIATQTGGQFYRVANSSDLTSLFIRLAAETTGNGILASAPENSINPNQVNEFPILVENGADSATFALTLANASDDITFSLKTPSGRIINKASASTAPGLEFISGPNSAIFRVAKPEAGTWKMSVSSGSVTTGKFGIVVFAEHEGVQLNLSVEQDTVAFPKAVRLEATPMFDGQAVVGAKVAGNVIRPDGSSIPIAFYDDGLRAHGDSLPNDGIYGAQFNTYNDDGTYVFEIAAENVNGRTFGGEVLFANSAPSNSVPVSPFIRRASTTSVVSGVPDFIVATTEFGPETINLKSQGNYVTAYIELPGPLNATKIDVSSVKINAIDGVAISPIPAKSSPTEVGDFDNDGVPDLMVKFDRAALQAVLSPGMREIRVEGLVGNQLFVGDRGVSVIQPGKTK